MKDYIGSFIKQYVKEYSLNKDKNDIWGEPLVECSDANDKMYFILKEVVGPDHALPTDYMEDAQTVISYFLPFSELVVNSNIEGQDSSREWARAYVETNDLIFNLNKYIREKLESFNYKATNIPATHNFDKNSLKSNWSHRHAAYISGLGKFGLNNMLITDKGCCGRVGSIITNLKIRPSIRNDHEYCLYKINGSCKKCVQRCSHGALKEDSYDRHKCYEILLYNDRLHKDLKVTDVCGKCCVNLPCSLSNPLVIKEIIHNE